MAVNVAHAAYCTGFADGCETALLMILGRDANGGSPYQGEVPDELKVYAEEALARIRKDKEAQT